LSSKSDGVLAVALLGELRAGMKRSDAEFMQ
jgi:hypothetical protein